MSTQLYHPNGARRDEREAFAAIEAATQTVPIVGYSVMWFMDGLWARHAELARVMADPQVGLGDFVPKLPSARVRLHRALEAMLRDDARARARMGQEDENDVERMLIRPMNDYSKEWMAFAIVGEGVKLMELALNYQTHWRVKFHKQTGHMVCVESPSGAIADDQDNPELAARLAPYWQEYQDRLTSRDLSLVVKRVIDWASAISLRKQGGVYFVPDEHEGTLDQVRTLIHQLTAIYGGEPVFLTLGVPDEQETRRQMSSMAHLALIEEADALLAELERMRAENDTTRERTRRDRMVRVALYRGKLDAYDFILGTRRDELVRRVEAVEAAMTRLVMED